jgi:hypothetical protein
MNNQMEVITSLTVNWDKRTLFVSDDSWPRWQLRWRVVLFNSQFEAIGDNMALVLSVIQKVGLSLQPVDAEGNPALVEDVRWAVANPEVATLIVSDDNLTAELIANTVGSTQVSVQVDAHIGEGVNVLVGSLDVQVVAAEAVSITIVAGSPENQE